MARLMPKHKRFADEYLVDLNAAQAVIRAGYKAKNEQRAAEIGYQLLQKHPVKEYISARQKQLAEQTEVTQDRVIKEIARIAFFDPRKAINQDGSPKSLTDLDDDTAAAIQGFELAANGAVLKYKVADKNSALDKLCRHLGFYDADKSYKPEIHLTGFVIESE